MSKTIIKYSKLTSLLFILIIMISFGNAADSDKRNVKLAKSIGYRQDLLIVGGTINAFLSTINIIIAGINLIIIYFKFQHCMLLIRTKLIIAINEVASKDLHPKLKFGLLHYSYDTTKQLPTTFQLISEKGPFDNLNDLFPNQKEMRVRKKNIGPEGSGPTSEAAQSSKQSTRNNSETSTTDSKM
ncbi:unnamed protein product [Caenorhabditis angaria]|uniref:Serpentine receptor class gamma n=1 Tax=Caenorhabditis angaria TaxID=860376 RepID=A0A9P1MVR1_9PELO|nr:unnamed protein product [Caenorhabditis angaria]